MKVALRTHAADDDLREIAFDVAVVSGRPRTADRMIDQIVGCCDRLAEMAPAAELGTAAPELGDGVRLLSYRRWVIIFRYTDEGVLILRIADGRQDYLAWKFG